jgi:hypothetical protein
MIDTFWRKFLLQHSKYHFFPVQFLHKLILATAATTAAAAASAAASSLASTSSPASVIPAIPAPSLLFFCVGGSWPDSHSGGASASAAAVWWPAVSAVVREPIHTQPMTVVRVLGPFSHGSCPTFTGWQPPPPH